jgi:integrase
MFSWLKDQGWIAVDPTTALRGESVENKAERKLSALGKKLRQPFTSEDLQLIFSQPWFKTGRGEMTKAGTFRQFQPFYYWLPLLGLYVGGRINELCQLRLDDVRQTDAGNWYLDINENTADKSLKRQQDIARCWSARKVPLHPALVQLGFVDWCQRLREQGFQRVFPELSWNPTNHYAKEPVRSMSQMLAKLGMPRDNTKVFHSFRHTVNNAIMRVTCPPEVRKRLLGHSPGDGVNEQHYLADPTPDEALSIVRQLEFALPVIASFDLDAGLAAVRDALGRKDAGRGGHEDMGGVAAGTAG